jgi:hypothetical protein
MALEIRPGASTAEILRQYQGSIVNIEQTLEGGVGGGKSVEGGYFFPTPTFNLIGGEEIVITSVKIPAKSFEGFLPGPPFTYLQYRQTGGVTVTLKFYLSTSSEFDENAIQFDQYTSDDSGPSPSNVQIPFIFNYSGLDVNFGLEFKEDKALYLY